MKGARKRSCKFRASCRSSNSGFLHLATVLVGGTLIGCVAG